MTDVAVLIKEVMRIDPSAPAVEWQGRWLTWGELSKQVDAICRLLDLAGVPKGERVGVVLRNRVPQLTALYAVALSQRCLVPIDPLCSDLEVADVITSLRLPVLLGELRDIARAGLSEAAAIAGSGVIVLPEAWDGTPEITRASSDDARQQSPTLGLLVDKPAIGNSSNSVRVTLSREAFQHSFELAHSQETGDHGELQPRLRSEVQVLKTPLTQLSGIWDAISGAAAGRRIVLVEQARVRRQRQLETRLKSPKTVIRVPDLLSRFQDTRKNISSSRIKAVTATLACQGILGYIFIIGLTLDPSDLTRKNELTVFDIPSQNYLLTSNERKSQRKAKPNNLLPDSQPAKHITSKRGTLIPRSSNQNYVRRETIATSSKYSTPLSGLSGTASSALQFGEQGDGSLGGGGGAGTDSGTEDVAVDLSTKAQRERGFLSGEDYPESAIRAGAKGEVTVHFTVEADGAVRRCVITESTGNAELDATTCRLIERRFKYRAARDATGRPIPENVYKTYEWLLP